MLSPLPPGRREGQGASPLGYSGAVLGCSQQKMSLQVPESGAGELLAAAEHRGMGLELTAHLPPPNCSWCDSEYKVYYWGKPQVLDLCSFSACSLAAAEPCMKQGSFALKHHLGNLKCP